MPLACAASLRGCGPEDADARRSSCGYRFASVLLRGCGPEDTDKQQEEPAEESTSDSTGSDVTVPDPPLEKSGTLAGDALQPPGSNAAAARDLEQQERRAAALRAQLTEGAKDGEAGPKKLAPAVHGTAKPAEPKQPPLAGRAKCAVCGRCRQTEAQATASHERSVFHLTWQHYSQGMTWRRAQERAKEDSARMWEQWYASRSDAAPSAGAEAGKKAQTDKKAVPPAPVKPRQPAQPAPVKPRQPAPVPPAPVKPRQPKEKAAEAAKPFADGKRAKQKKRSRPSPSLDPPERPKKHRRDPSPDGSGRGGGEVGKVLTSLFETAVNALLHSQQR
ncbi:unnamed protein product [Effrenium voratum]|nr:unnamed protein product [Effrenium voratum]